MSNTPASRRRLWRQALTGQANVIRPPWALEEALFIERCTRCSVCIDVCPTQVIKKGDGGFPEVDFTWSECTFCGKCEQSCDPAALDKQHQDQPWPIKAAVQSSCMAQQGVVCRTCEEQCEVGAISFQIQARGIATPQVDTAACTGCGACVAPCPVSALEVRDEVKGVVREQPDE